MVLGSGQVARAQISAEVTLTTDYRLKGYSLSHREPALALSLGYDDKSGFFVDGTAVILHRPAGGIALLGGIGAIGCAARIDDDLSIDAGLLRAEFTRHASFGRPVGYTEIFAGVTGRSFAFRAALSPDYYWRGTTTLYLSGDAVHRPWPKWRIVGHAGALATLSGGPPYPAAAIQYDWSLKVGRQIGPADLELAYSNGGPNREAFDGASHPKSALIATARWSF